MGTGMTLAQKREARIALAMLPVGATVLVASALALILVAALGLDLLVRRPAGWGWTGVWALVASAVALRNMRAGIAVMSAFDWRPLPLTLLLSAAITASWPGWWIG